MLQHLRQKKKRKRYQHKKFEKHLKNSQRIDPMETVWLFSGVRQPSWRRRGMSSRGDLASASRSGGSGLCDTAGGKEGSGICQIHGVTAQKGQNYGGADTVLIPIGRSEQQRQTLAGKGICCRDSEIDGVILCQSSLDNSWTFSHQAAGDKLSLSLQRWCFRDRLRQ